MDKYNVISDNDLSLLEAKKVQEILVEEANKLKEILPEDLGTIGNRMGFIETVEDILTLYREMVKDNPNSEALGTKGAAFREINFEEKVAFQRAIEHMKRADLYFMGAEFQDMLLNYREQFDELDFNQVRFSEFTRPPSRICYIRLDHYRKLWDDIGTVSANTMKNLGFITEYLEDKRTLVSSLAPQHGPMLLGAYHPDEGLTFTQRIMDNKMSQTFGDIMIRIAGSFELINNPKYITSQPVGTRAQRRRLHREQDIAVEAWHKITWNVDEDTVEVNKGDRGGWRMPLHYTRGHPRKAEPHHKKIFYKDGLPYKWIHGFWSGHPAFGIKKGYHAPTISAA